MNTGNLDFNHLKVLDAVRSPGDINRAARMAGMSQPTVDDAPAQRQERR